MELKAVVLMAERNSRLPESCCILIGWTEVNRVLEMQSSMVTLSEVLKLSFSSLTPEEEGTYISSNRLS